MADRCPVHDDSARPFDAAYFADPYPTYTRLRDAAPVHRVCLGDLGPEWLVTRYDDVRDGLRDQRLARHPSFAGPGNDITPFRPEMLAGNLLMEDPPEHTRLRGYINFAFTPRRVEVLRPRIGEIVDELLDAVVSDSAAADDRADLMAALAAPLPITMIGDMLGVPADARADFRAWTDAVIGGTREEGKAAGDLLLALLTELIAVKRAEPADDLVSFWLGTGELSDDEMRCLAFMLLVGGQDTTVGTIGNVVLALLRHPDRADELRAHPERIDDAVEELIRWDGSAHNGFRRFATEDMTIGGVHIGAGDRVSLSIASAQRDPRRFADPDELDFARDTRRHLGFGRARTCAPVRSWHASRSAPRSARCCAASRTCSSTGTARSCAGGSRTSSAC